MSKNKNQKEGIKVTLANEEVEFILSGLDLLKEKDSEHRKEIEKIETDLIMKNVWHEQTGGIFDMFLSGDEDEEEC